jgi:hypothetical protein
MIVIITTDITTTIVIMIATMTVNELNDLDFSEFSSESPYGFSGFIPIEKLLNSCEGVPRKPGVYIVSVPKGFAPKFLQKSLVFPYPKKRKNGGVKVEDPSESVEKLKKKWVAGTTVIYIGQTTKQTLKKRLEQYMRFGRSKSINHEGGKFIWQLENVHSCPIAWTVLAKENPKAAERYLLEHFKEQYGRFPFANHRP